MTSSEDD